MGWIAWGVLVALFLFHGWRTAEALLHVWPENAEVQFVWQEALTKAARYLDETDEVEAVAVGGWTPETMDPPTMELTLRREELVLRYFDPREGVVLPVGGGIRSSNFQSQIVRPTILPFHPLVASALERMGVRGEALPSFTVYRLPEPLVARPQIALQAQFGEELHLLGYDIGTSCTAERCTLLTYWQVTATAASQRRLFLHLLDEGGTLLDQDDGLGAPALYWQVGDLILQVMEVAAVTAETELHLGVYDPQTRVRLLTEAGDEFVSFKPMLNH
jgi:hypothetical protein